MFKLPNNLDRKYLKICCYAVITIAVAYGLCMVLSFSGGFFTKLWELISAVLVPMVYGALLNYLLQPVVRKVFPIIAGEKIPEENPRLWSLSVIIALLLVLVVVGAIVTVLLVVVTHSLSGINVESLLGLIEHTQGDIDEFFVIVTETLSDFGISTEGLGANVKEALFSVKDALTTALFSIIFAIYFLLDGNSVVTYGKRLVYALVGNRFDARADQLFADADRAFSGYIRGQFVDAVVVGALSALVLTIIGVPYGAVVGLLTGIGNLIPYVGGPLGIVTIVLVCLAKGEFVKLAMGVVGIIIVMFLDSNVINPRLLSANVEVHPLLVVAALLAGGAVGGIAGMLVAVPTAAFLKMQLDRWMDSRGVAVASADGGEHESLMEAASDGADAPAPSQDGEKNDRES